MGQKVNPTNFRTGVIYDWKSRWFAGKKGYQDFVVEDYKIREYLNESLSHAGLVQVEIERSLSKVKLLLTVSRPGVVIGKGGKNLEKIKHNLEDIMAEGTLSKDNAPKKKPRIDLRVEEVKQPNLSAKLICERIESQLLRRYPHRRAISQAIQKVMEAGAEGVKIQLSGRIRGAEIGRTEKYSEGKVPTQTLRADIDYYETPAKTRSGYVGIKVWIYKGEIV